MTGLPLSFAQSRLWFLNEISGPDTQYNVPLVIRCRSRVDAAALRLAIRDVVLRHEVLRSTYACIGGVPAQVVHGEEAIPDLLCLRDRDQQSQADALAELLAHTFDLSRDIPFRAWLLRCESATDVVVVMVHHIAMDGGSLSPLLEDLGDAYSARRRGESPEWEELPLQYADFAAWQRRFLGDADDPTSLSHQQRNYWRAQLAGLPEQVTLPVSGAARPHSRAGGCLSIALPDEASRLVVEVARHELLAPVTVVRAAIAAMLTRAGVGVDVPLAGFVSGRTDAALDRLVGMFVNTVALRVDTSGDPPFRELLRRVKKVEDQAYSHQDLPFDEVVREIHPLRASTRHPLVQIAVSYEDRVDLQLPEFDADVELGENERSKFDLYVAFVADRDGDRNPVALEMSWRFARSRFDDASIHGIAAHFINVLLVALRNIDKNISCLPSLGGNSTLDGLR